MTQYTCLIAEDSPAEREGLRYLLEEKRYPLRILEAGNGEIALDCMRKEKVDILITDICMPFLSGLELAEALRKLGKSTKILICSAYGEFSYAKQAIACNVSGYLLKPVQRCEFNALFDRVMEELNQQDRQESLAGLELEKCWYDVMHGFGADDDMRVRLHRLGVDMDTVRPVLALACFENRTLECGMKALEQAISFRVDGMWLLDMFRVLLLLKEEKMLSRDALVLRVTQLQAEMEQAMGCKPAILAAQPLDGASELQAAFQALEKQEELFLYEPGSVHILGECHEPDDGEAMDTLNRFLSEAEVALAHRNYNEAYERMEMFASCLKLFGNTPAPYMRYMTMGAISAVLRHRGGEKSQKKILDEVLTARTVGQLADLVERHMRVLLPDDAPSMEEHAVKRIIRTIHEQYMEDLTLDSLARSVYLSPPYVSCLFRKHTGTTLIKYITGYRMKRAAEMLRSGNRSVTDVAQKVGYGNISYFSSLFKSYYGVSPTQYGKEQRCGGALK